jgi:hypothetical protein
MLSEGLLYRLRQVLLCPVLLLLVPCGRKAVDE